jgi:hypothetical protein
MTPKRSTLKLALAWVLSLVVVAAASRLMLAQTTGDKRIVTGSDLGFRIDSDRGGVPTGRFVVRVNGTWVEVKETVGAARLTQ